jgi:hypothetical protein
MRRARRWAALAVTVLLPVTAGCAAEEPAPVVEPPVRNERDARGVDPCALPTSQQLKTLGISPAGAAVTAPEGRRCEWREAGQRPLELGITLYTDGGGLATLAANSEPSTARVRVAGYPALETFTGAGEFCQYDVGVAPNQVLMASLEGGTPDSCTALQSVLPEVVGSLPALDT